MMRGNSFRDNEGNDEVRKGRGKSAFPLNTEGMRMEETGWGAGREQGEICRS